MASSSSISVREASLTFGFLVLLSALAFRSLIPPAMVSASASANQFSAERAFKHLRFISREPHPTGSAANASVRDYIVNQLNSLGLEPQMQEAVAATSWDIGGAPYASGVVQNVLGRVSGSNSTGAVLLMVLVPLPARLRTTQCKTTSASLIPAPYRIWGTTFFRWLATSAISI